MGISHYQRIPKTIGVTYALYSTIISGIANGFVQLAKSVGATNNKIYFLLQTKRIKR
jgi:hypothetical protein